MLLGPGTKLKLRHDIKATLAQKGYTKENIIIMEYIKDDENYLDEKFGNILEKYAPLLFFALFHQKERMHGVIFELGWICGKYTRPEISERLRIVLSTRHDYTQTTRYMQSIFHTSWLLPIEKMNINQISQCIHDNVTLTLERRKWFGRFHTS
jgi:hypothetical protein